jgi:hypothetical protein
MKYRTDWFPGNVFPIRKGVYQRNYGKYEICLSYWDGIEWGFGIYKRPYEAKWAERRRYPPSSKQNLPWRGMTEEAYKIAVVRVMENAP